MYAGLPACLLGSGWRAARCEIIKRVDGNFRFFFTETAAAWYYNSVKVELRLRILALLPGRSAIACDKHLHLASYTMPWAYILKTCQYFFPKLTQHIDFYLSTILNSLHAKSSIEYSKIVVAQ